MIFISKERRIYNLKPNLLLRKFIFYKHDIIKTETISCCMPIKVVAKLFNEAGTSIENLPLTLVVNAVLIPFAVTVAPGRIIPFSSETVYVIFLTLENAVIVRMQHINMHNGSLDFI